MTGFYVGSSGRKYVFFEVNGSLRSFSIMYGIKGKSAKGGYAENLLPSKKKNQLKSINELNPIEKRITIQQAFNRWYYA